MTSHYCEVCGKLHAAWRWIDNCYTCEYCGTKYKFDQHRPYVLVRYEPSRKGDRHDR